MPECEKLKKCLFFNDQMAGMPAMADMYKNRYCRGDKTKCARYMLASRGLPVPDDLYPNQVNRASELLASEP